MYDRMARVRRTLKTAALVGAAVPDSPWENMTYAERILDTQPAYLIGYWPMWEGGGAKSQDYSREGNNGAYTGVDLAQVGIGDGTVCPWFDGATDYNNIYSTALAADFSGTQGTMLVWFKPNSAAVWADGTARVIGLLRVNAGNRVDLRKHTVANTIILSYLANATNLNLSTIAYATSNWQCVALTWSATANEVRPYVNGVQEGSTLTGLGAWSGALTSTTCLIGAANTTPGNVWHGWLAHAAVWKVALTPAEIYALGRL